MKVELSKDGKQLIITVDAETVNPSVSPTGKTRCIFSSHGNQTTQVQVQGKPVVIGLNAYISNR